MGEPLSIAEIPRCVSCLRSVEQEQEGDPVVCQIAAKLLVRQAAEMGGDEETAQAYQLSGSERFTAQNRKNTAIMNPALICGTRRGNGICDGWLYDKDDENKFVAVE